MEGMKSHLTSLALEFMIMAASRTAIHSARVPITRRWCFAMQCGRAAPSSSSGLVPGVLAITAEERVGMVRHRLALGRTAPLPSRRLPLQVADPKRFMVFASLLAEFDLRRMRRLGGGH